MFGFLGFYLTVTALWLTVRAFVQAADKSNGEFFLKLFTTEETSVMVAALAASYGVYLIASCLYADPWHSEYMNNDHHSSNEEDESKMLTSLYLFSISSVYKFWTIHVDCTFFYQYSQRLCFLQFA